MSLPRTCEISSSTGSLGLHIVTILELSAASRPASREDPVSGFLLAALRCRLFPCCLCQRTRQRHAAEAMAVVETAAAPVRASPSRACGQPYRIDAGLPPPRTLVAG